MAIIHVRGIPLNPQNFNEKLRIGHFDSVKFMIWGTIVKQVNLL